MPVTHVHLGPGLALKALLGRRMNGLPGVGALHLLCLAAGRVGAAVLLAAGRRGHPAADLGVPR